MGALLALICAGCRHLEPSATPRAAEPLPADLASALRPSGQAWGLEIEPDERFASGTFQLRFWVFDELRGDFREVTGAYYRAPGASKDSPAPLVTLSPILGGTHDDYLASRYFARKAAERGLCAFFLYQEGVILDPSRDGLSLERRMRDSVRDQILALDLLSRRVEVDSSRLGSFGISLGAIKNVVLIAAEPRLSANVLCIAGTDLPRILVESREGLVEEYLEGREDAEGLVPCRVADEIRAQLRSRPANVSAAIDPARVLLFLARLDNKVPFETGVELREALGEPRAWILPAGHYTSLVLAPWVAGAAFEWMSARWDALSSPSASRDTEGDEEEPEG